MPAEGLAGRELAEGLAGPELADVVADSDGRMMIMVCINRRGSSKIKERRLLHMCKGGEE